MPSVCFVPGCKTGLRSERMKRKISGEKIPLFKSPKDLAIFEIWKRSIPRVDKELRITDHLCARHFKEEDIERFYETKIYDGSIFRLKRSKVRLKPGAIPCIFPDAPGHSTYIPKEVENSKSKTSKKKRKEKRTPSSTPSSKEQKKSGKLKTSLSEKKTKQKKVSSIQLGKENILFEGIVFHPIPQNPPVVQSTLLKEREDAENDMNSTPLQDCSINDSEPSFINPSSTIDVLENENSTLSTCEDMPNEPNDNSTSPPLQNCSIYDSESSFMNSSPTVNVLEKEYSMPGICEEILNESNVILSKSVVEEQFSFNFLKINVNMIDTMNSWWKVNVLDDFISFIRWMPNYKVERKIVITKDLAVKVFLKDKETTIGHDLKMLSIDVISKLIFRVERTQICRGIHQKERNCDGFLQGVFQCKKHNLCLSCIKWEREQRKLLMKPVKLPSNLVELIRFNIND